MNRTAGVSLPQSQNHIANQQPTNGQPRTLLSMQKIETYGVQFIDDNGTAHTALAHKMGEVIYVHPSDEQWASTIRTASGWLAQAVREKIYEHDASVAAASVVEVAKPLLNVTPPKAAG